MRWRGPAGSRRRRLRAHFVVGCETRRQTVGRPDVDQAPTVEVIGSDETHEARRLAEPERAAHELHQLVIDAVQEFDDPESRLEMTDMRSEITPELLAKIGVGRIPIETYLGTLALPEQRTRDSR